MKSPTLNQSPILCLLVVLTLLLFSTSAAYAQCVMACNDGVEIALDNNCMAEITPDKILEGLSTTNCVGPFEVLVMDAGGNPIPSNPFVNASHIGLNLIVKVTDQASGNNCWGSINVIDGLAPDILCDTIRLPCGFSTDPVDRPVLTGVLPVLATPMLPIGPAAADTNRLGLLAGLPDNAIVTDVDITLNIAHSNSEQLDVYLISPTATVVELATDVCGNNSNWSNVTFDDEALMVVNAACGGNPALSGAVQPEGLLADFDSLPASGLWQLMVIDDTNGGSGSLTSATLNISYTQLAAYRPITSDACSAVTLTHVDATTPGTCSDDFTQIIRRTWTATDASNNSRSCTQVIISERATIDDLRIPASHDGILQPALLCDDRQSNPGNLIIPNVGWNALPNGHPSPFNEYYPAPNNNIIKWYGTGQPEGGCGNFLATFNDTRIDQCSGGSSACFKIVREWLITDWCTGMIHTRLQVIKVADHEAPMISGIDDTTISVNPWGCTADWYVPAPSLSDNCNPTASLTYTVSTPNATVSQTNSGSYLITGLAIGIHTVTYSASDCCGNTRDSSIQLTVVDNILPSVACDEHTQAALNIDGTTKVFATTFDDGSTDNCGPVYFKVIRFDELLGTDHGSELNQNASCDGLNGDDDNSFLGNQVYFDDFARFCCADIGNANLQVVLRVFDIDPGSGPVDPDRMDVGGDLEGHFSECMVFIELVDKIPPRITCPADVRLECTQDYTDLSLTGMATATDNCQLDSLFYTDVTDLNMCNAGMVTRTWMAIDHQGLMAVCTQKITLIDPTTPVFFFPPDVTVTCGGSDDPANTGEPYGVDGDCSFISSTYTDLVFWFQDSCLRKVLREWKIIDWCSGASQTDLQVIKELDDLPPVFSSMPADTLVDCDIVPPPANITITDNCDPSPMLVFTENRTDGNCMDNYTLRRSWVATDRCGNIDSIIQLIMVQDTLPPVITSVPSDTTVNCDAVPAPAMPIASDNCDPAPSLQFSEQRTDGNCADNYSLRRRWISTDRCGNSDSLIQIITVQDTLPPTLVGTPMDTLVDCNSIPATAMVSSADNCDPMPQLSFLETRIDGNCTDNYSLRRVWTSIDRCGNRDSSIQIITVQDTLAPVIMGTPTDTTVDCHLVPSAPVLTATDNCDPNPIVTFQQTRTDGNCTDNYSLRRVWTTSDRCGNEDSTVQIITVIDTIPPVLNNIPMDVTTECMEGPVPNTITATDFCDPMVDIQLMVSPSVGPCDGNNQLVRTWIATDNCGNTATATQIVTLIDTLPPTLIGTPMDTLVNCNSIPAPAMVSSIDNCDLMPQLSFTETRTDGDCADRYSLRRVWTSVDDCGNRDSSIQVITVQDTLAPLIMGTPADTTVDCHLVPNAPMLSAIDNCDPNPLVTFQQTRTDGNCTDNYSLRRVWTTNDRCGNEDSTIQIITVIDTIPPVLSNVPMDITVECMDGTAPNTVTATDLCDPMVDVQLMVSPPAGPCDGNNQLVRTWVATDNCGNTATATQIVTLIDTLPPTLIDTPMDTLVNCNSIPAPAMVSSVDNCDLMPQLSFMETRIDGNCADRYSLRRVWTSIDDCGNRDSSIQIITVQDTLAPLITGTPADTTVDCHLVPSAPMLSAMDNCDPNPIVTFQQTRTDGNCTDNYSLRRVWTTIDRCGNEDSTVQIITVIDTIPPVLDNIPMDVTLQCMEGPAPNTVTATDLCDPMVDIQLMVSPPAEPCSGSSQLVRTWVATDNCGNTATAIQVVTLIDTIPPVITGVPNDTIVDCHLIPPTATPTALDDCTMATLTMTEEEEPGICRDERTLVRIWRAVDECGNETRDTQRIMVIDTIPPIFDISPPDTTVRCDNVPNPIRTISATDLCDTDVEITLVADTIDRICDNAYTIRRAWIAGDNCGNITIDTQILIVIDTAPPMLTGVPSDTMILCNRVPAPATVTANDDCAGLPPVSFRADTIDRICDDAFTIRRYWMAMDNCGNVTQDSQLLMVIDTIAPLLSGVPDDTTVICDDIPATPIIGSDITATDNCDAMVDIQFSSDTINRDPVCPHALTIVRRWVAEDNCGNMSQDSQLVMVIDTIAPILLGIPNDTIVNCDDIPDEPVIDNDVTVTDNCDVDPLISFRADTIGGNCEAEFTIYRIWRATDKCSNTVIDTQVIMTIDTVPPLLMGVPANVTVDCRAIPDVPVIGTDITATDNCDTSVVITFMRESQGPCPHSFTLTRTWTATDDCGNQSQGVQLITVIDTIAPTFTMPLPPRKEPINSKIKCDTFLSIIVPAIDNCDDNVSITHDSPHAPFNTVGDASGIYPIGEYTITFTATDACGNVSTQQLLLEVFDNVGPEIACDAQVVTLDPVTGTYTIYPEDFATAVDLCSPPSPPIISFLGPNPDSIVLNCEDLPRVLLTVQAFDSVGIEAVCGATVTILLPPENPSICDTMGPLSTIVSGQIMSDEGNYLPEVAVNAEGGMSATDMTEEFGYFAFDQLILNEPYNIAPYDNEDPLQGVNSYDLVLISRHILGINSLTSPYKMIAADVNKSGSITTLDMLELRKMILYIDTAFQHNTSWRFVPEGHDFDDPTNPFISSFPESYDINKLEGSMIDLDFTGIKIGDLNGSAYFFTQNDLEDRNARKPLQLYTSDQLLKAGEEYQMDVRAEDFEELAGLQFTLNFDTDLLEFVEVENTLSVLDMKANNFGENRSKEGQLTASWGAYPAHQLKGDEVLFSLRFRAKAPLLLSKALQLSSDRTPIGVFDEKGRTHNLQLRFDQEQTFIAQKEAQLFQNRPNPFANETLIPFYLPKATNVELSIFDVSGKLVKRISRLYQAGYHEAIVYSHELPEQAVYFYQLQTEQFTSTKKMILTER